jgi:hypothetical protein
MNADPKPTSLLAFGMQVSLASILAGLLTAGLSLAPGCSAENNTQCVPVFPACGVGCGQVEGALCCSVSARGCSTSSCSTSCDAETCSSTETSCTTTSCSSCSSCTSSCSPSCSTSPESCEPTVCTPGGPRPCSGAFTASGTDAPACELGVQICDAAGKSFSTCTGLVRASPDACGAPAAWSCGGVPPSCGGATTAALLPIDPGATIGNAAATPDGAVVVSASAPPMVGGTRQIVAKLDPAGNVLWSTEITGASTVVVAASPTGAVFAAGVFFGTLSVVTPNIASNSANAGFALALDGDTGAVTWGRALSIGFLPSAIAATSTGDLAIAGVRTRASVMLDGKTAAPTFGNGLVAFLGGADGSVASLQGVGTQAVTPTATEHVAAMTLATDTFAVVAMSVDGCGGGVELGFGNAQGAARATEPLALPLLPTAAAVDARGRLLLAGDVRGPLPPDGAAPPGAVFAIDLITQAIDARVELPAPVSAMTTTDPGDVYVVGEDGGASPFVARVDLDMNAYFIRDLTLTPPASGGPASALFGGVVALPSGAAVVGALTGTLDFGVGFASMPVTSTSTAHLFYAELGP